MPVTHETTNRTAEVGDTVYVQGRVERIWHDRKCVQVKFGSWQLPIPFDQIGVVSG